MNYLKPIRQYADLNYVITDGQTGTSNIQFAGSFTLNSAKYIAGQSLLDCTEIRPPLIGLPDNALKCNLPRFSDLMFLITTTDQVKAKDIAVDP